MPPKHNRTLLHVWLRKEHGRASQTARDLNVSRQTIYNWVHGRGIPSTDHQVAIAQMTNGKVAILHWPERGPVGRPPKNKT